jgi:hypothetical protein
MRSLKNKCTLLNSFALVDFENSSKMQNYSKLSIRNLKEISSILTKKMIKLKNIIQ